MVGQVVASAVAPVAVQSATEETGLVNQLFKIGILIGGLLLIGLAVAIVIFIFNLDFSGIFGFITRPFNAISRGFDASFSVFTGIASGFGFGGKKVRRPSLISRTRRFLR
jgi:hypothetical protein